MAAPRAAPKKKVSIRFCCDSEVEEPYVADAEVIECPGENGAQRANDCGEMVHLVGKRRPGKPFYAAKDEQWNVEARWIQLDDVWVGHWRENNVDWFFMWLDSG
jgi:hypothetical protein